MLVEHKGRRPTIAASALVARSAVVSGDVHVGAGTVVLAGAVVTSQGGAPVRIGECCVVMENAVIRGAGKYPTTIGSYVLVGPNAHVSGATVDSRVYLATGAAVFNGAVLEEGSVGAINAVVHIATRLTAGSFVPIGHIAFGDPARIDSPSEDARLAPGDRRPRLHEERVRARFEVACRSQRHRGAVPKVQPLTTPSSR
jgi:carbonic anhydrase/acetyltransferase-like protein (isoleucine patch superfamily)